MGIGDWGYREIWAAVRFAVRIELRKRRRLQFREKLRLAGKALFRVGLVTYQHLDRSGCAERYMLHAIDLSRASASDERRQPPVTKDCADGEATGGSNRTMRGALRGDGSIIHRPTPVP